MEKSDQTEAFWQKVKEVDPDAGDDYRVRSLGADQDMAEMLFDLIKTGNKSGTFGLKMLHDLDPVNAPTVGRVTIMVDFHGKPHLAVKVVEVTPVAYKDITDDHVSVDGPTMRTVEAWKGVHWPFWTALLTKHGLTPSEDMIVEVERFEQIYPTSS